MMINRWNCCEAALNDVMCQRVRHLFINRIQYINEVFTM